MILYCCLEQPNHRLCLPVTAERRENVKRLLGPDLAIYWETLVILAAFTELADRLPDGPAQEIRAEIRLLIDWIELPGGATLRLLSVQDTERRQAEALTSSLQHSRRS